MDTQGNNSTSSVTQSERASNVGSTNTAVTKQATGKQLVAICFILALATKMFLLPIFLIRATGRDAYIILAIYGGIDLVALGMALAAIKIAKADFFEILECTIGKIGARIVVALTGLFLFFKLNTAVAEILTFYGTNVFSDFDTTLMAIVLLVFLAATGVHTLRALCRLNELLAPMIVACLAVLVMIVVMTAVDLANILPAVRDAKGFADGAVHHAAWLGDFTPLVLFIGRTKLKKHSHVFAAAGGVVGTCVAVFFALVLSAAFGNVPMLVDNTTNLSTMLQFTVGNVYGRLDMFSSVLWSIAVFVEAALFFYSTCRCVAYVIGRNSHLWISLGAAVAVYVVQVFALIDPMNFAVTVTSPACSIVVPIFAAGVPLVALVCSIVYNVKQDGGFKKKKHDKDKTGEARHDGQTE